MLFLDMRRLSFLKQVCGRFTPRWPGRKHPQPPHIDISPRRTLPSMAISDVYHTALNRLAASANTVPTVADWVQVSLITAAICAASLPIGLKTKFFKWEPVSIGQAIGPAIFTIIAPGFTEEAIFRAALLPHPKVNARSFPPTAAAFAASALLPLIIFVAYHLVNPDRRTRAVFWDVRFLTLAAILGIGCTASYYMTGGSLVAAAFTHWLPVQLWLFLLGGLNKTQPLDTSSKKE